MSYDIVSVSFCVLIYLNLFSITQYRSIIFHNIPILSSYSFSTRAACQYSHQLADQSLLFVMAPPQAPPSCIPSGGAALADHFLYNVSHSLAIFFTFVVYFFLILHLLSKE